MIPKSGNRFSAIILVARLSLLCIRRLSGGRPARIICAMPRASFRSVLLICAFNTARMCRVSTQITGKSASARALNSHCDSGPASSPILEVVGGVLQHRQQSVRFTLHLHLPHDPARVIHNADTCLLDRNVQSSKMVHAALLLLMLEALTTDLVSPSA